MSSTETKTQLHSILTYRVLLPSGFGAAVSGLVLKGNVFKCLYSPNETMSDFQRRLDALAVTTLGTEGRILVGGDFNAGALKWGMPHPNSRGKRILEMAARTGLIVLNTGSTPMFPCPGSDGCIPDVIFYSESLMSRSIIEPKSTVKYFGLTLHSKMNFFEQIKAAANKFRS